MRKFYILKSIVLLFILAAPFAGQSLKGQLIYGCSPFQDSMWAMDTTASYVITSRLAPSLSGFTITGITGMAWDPIGHKTYVVMKVSGVSGRVLGTMDVTTGICTQVGNLGDNFASITFRHNGQLLGVVGNGGLASEQMFTINKATGVPTLAVALGNGADGEIICYNEDDDMIYHWSGNGTVVYEKFPSLPPYTPVTNIPVIGAPGGETFGGIYLGNGNFIISNISSNLKHLSTNGTYAAGTLSNNPDDLRGLVMPPSFAFDSDTVCVEDTVNWTLGNAGFAIDSAVYHWGDGTTSTVFPAGSGSHAYTAPGTYTTYAILKNDTVGEDTLASATILVQALPGVFLTPPTDTILCLVDTLDITATSGGTSQWYMNGAPIPGANTPTYTATVAGVYNMEKTNLNGCRDSAATGILVRFGDLPTVNLGADSTLCDGDTVCISLSNPQGVTYLWSTGSTSNAECFTVTGSYFVDATDTGGCKASDTVALAFILAPSPSIGVDSSGCPAIAFTSNDPNGTSWSWTFGDAGTSTQQNPSHTYTANGSYTVVVTATNQCFSGSDSLSINIDCIIAVDPAFQNAISIAPNPSNGSFLLNVSLPAPGALRYAVSDLSGRTLLENASYDIRSDWSEQVEFHAAPGIYFLSVESGTDRAVYRIMVE